MCDQANDRAFPESHRSTYIFVVRLPLTPSFAHDVENITLSMVFMADHLAMLHDTNIPDTEN